jgi:DNA-binding NarL/FixJ family response regulator
MGLKVLIADDHPLILQGLRRTLEASPDIDIVGEARTGTELLALVERRKPDAVLMDMHMPELDGLACLEHITKTWPEVKTVVLSAYGEQEQIDAALLAGANAYVVKSVSHVDVASVLRQAAEGAVHHAPARSAAVSNQPQPPTGPCLTDRETTILGAIASGQTTKAIGQELWVSEHTVKFHITNIYRKLGVSNRTGAVRFALEHGLVGHTEPGDGSGSSALASPVPGTPDRGSFGRLVA